MPSQTNLAFHSLCNTRYDDLQAYFRDLNAEYNASRDVVRRLSEEMAAVRQSAADGAEGLLLILALTEADIILAIKVSENLSRCAKTATRAFGDELQSDRANGLPLLLSLRLIYKSTFLPTRLLKYCVISCTFSVHRWSRLESG